MTRCTYSIVAVTAVVFGALLPDPAAAGVMSTSASFNSFSGSGTDPREFVRLSQFDTLGGRRVLESVDIHYDVDRVVVFLYGENFRSTPITTTVTLTGAVRFDGPPSADSSVPISATRTYSLARSDGIANSGPDFFRDDVLMTGHGSRQGDPRDFIGTGTFVIRISGGGPVEFTQSVNGPRHYAASFSGSVSIDYRYSHLSSVPEPNAAVLCLTGVAVVAGYRGLRRGKVAATHRG